MMGKEEITALIKILEKENSQGIDSLVLGTWNISYNKTLKAFSFDKCENSGYCEERPSVINKSGEVLDKGGPLFQ
jgi:hypothetical protein